MTIVRCLGCRLTFDEPIGYLGHDCQKPTDVALSEALVRVELIFDELEDALDTYEAAIDAATGQDDDDELEEDPWGFDDDEILSNRETVKIAGLLVVGVIVGLSVLAYETVAGFVRKVIR